MQGAVGFRFCVRSCPPPPPDLSVWRAKSPRRPRRVALWGGGTDRAGARSSHVTLSDVPHRSVCDLFRTNQATATSKIRSDLILEVV